MEADILAYLGQKEFPTYSPSSTFSLTLSLSFCFSSLRLVRQTDRCSNAQLSSVEGVIDVLPTAECGTVSKEWRVTREGRLEQNRRFEKIELETGLWSNSANHSTRRTC